MLFSAELSVLLFFCPGFLIFRYAGKIPKNHISNQRSRSFREAKGGPQGSQAAARRVPGAAPPPGRATCPPGWVPHPLVTYLGSYIFSHRGNSGREVAFSIYAAELPQTLCSSSES